MPFNLKIPGIGIGLRLLRQKHGLSLSDLADRIGCDRTSLSKYENGHTAVTLDFLHSVAESLGESPEAVVLFCLNEHYDLEGTKAWNLMTKLVDEVRAEMGETDSDE